MGLVTTDPFSERVPDAAVAIRFLNTGAMQDEVAKRHCFACIVYIAEGIVEGSCGHDAQQKRSTASLSKVLSAFDVGYGFPDCPC